MSMIKDMFSRFLMKVFAKGKKIGTKDIVDSIKEEVEDTVINEVNKIQKK